MLARLEDLGGIRRAETDFAGDFLRLSLTDGTPLSVAIETLATLGYRAEPAEGTAAVRTWYDARSVGELSFVEAGVIADRVLAEVAERHRLPGEGARDLRAAIVEALHACFITKTLDAGPSSGEFRAACVRATVAAAVPVVGTRLADEIGRSLDADMTQIHRVDPF